MTIDIDAIRRREQAATEGPWFYDSYSGVFSAPKVALWDPWLDTVDGSHSMERHGRCEACGKDGCRLFSEAYDRDPLVAHVPAHHGDTATGMHAADAAFIAHARKDVPALLAELDRVRADLAAAHNHAHRQDTNLQQIVRAKDETAAERDALKQQLAAQQSVIEAARAWVESSVADFGRTGDALTAAVEALPTEAGVSR